jgi:hypothetical protein
MKRFGLSFTLSLLSFTVLFGQAREGTMEYDKKKQEAIVIEYSFTQEAVENALIKRIEDMGNQAKEEKGVFNKDKGCIVFKNAMVSEISGEMLNYVVKIERKSRKNEDETVLYMIINNKDGEDMIAKDADYARKAKSFLNDLLPHIESANLDIRIRTQESSVTKAEKKYKDLQSDQASMEKKIKGLQDDLKENAKDQEAQQKEIEVQRQTLADLKKKKG